MAIETIGFRAVVDNLQSYLAAVNQIAASNTRLAQSELNYAKAAVTADSRIAGLRRQQIAAQGAVVAAVQSGQARINEFRIRSADIATRLSQRIVASEVALERSNARVSRSLLANGVASKAALEARATAQRNLDNTIINSNARLAAVARARGNLETQIADQVAAAELRRLAVDQQVTRISVQNDLAETSSNLKLAAAREVAAAAAAKEAAAATAAATRPVATGVRGLALGASIAALGAFRLAADAAGKATNLFGRALIAITGFSNRAAVALRFGALAIGAFTAAFTIGAASNFENLLARIDVLTEATAGEVAQLSEEFKTLSATIPKSPEELGTATYFVLSSGIKDVNEALEVTTLAAKAATIGLGTTEEVAKVITSVINAYGKENISAAQATDILVAAIQQGSAEAPEFTQGLGRLLGIAPALGIEFDQLASAVAALTNVGLPANQAITAILGVMNQLISPSANAEESLRAVGLSIQELRTQIDQEGLIPALQNMLSAFGNNQQALEDLFPEVRGLTGALLLLREESGAYDEILAAVANSSGITEQGFARMSETFQFQANLLKNQLNVLLINLGETILPSLTAKLQELIGWVDRNKESIIEWTVSIGTLVATILGGFLKGIGIIINAMDSIIDKKIAVVGTFVAIGTAIVTNLGPRSRATAALFLIVTLLGRISQNRAAEGFARNLGFVGEEAEKLDKLLKDLEKRQLERPTVNFGSPEFLRGELEKNLESIPVSTSVDEIAIAIGERLAEIRREQAQADAIATEAAEASKKALEEIERAYNDQEVATDKLKNALQDASITFEEAAELGLSAIEAGALEVSAATNKTAEAAFNYERAMSRVANAFSVNIDLARQFALDASRNAVDATRDAASALFARPTQEIISLELSLLQLQQANISTIQGLDSQSDALDSQSDALDKTSEAIDKHIEGLQEQIETLNEGTNKLKEFDDQIRELLGIEAPAPNSITPPTPAIIPQNILIPGAILTEAEQEILRLVKEREKEVRKLELERQIEAAQAEKERIAEQKQAIAEQKQAIADQIESVRNSEESIQRQIDLYTLQNEAAQKQIDAADQTLLTQEELTKKAGEVAREMFEQSGAIRALSDLLNQDLIPEMDLMREAAKLAKDALLVLEDTDFREIFLAYQNQLETIAEQQEVALQAIFAPLNTEVETLTTNIKNLNEAFEVPEVTEEDFTQGLPGRQHGGLITSPEIAKLGEHGLPELVLPLSEPTRSRELMMSLPAGLLAQISPQRSSGPQVGSLLGDFQVTGYIPSEMRHMVVNEVRRQLTRSGSRRNLKSIGL